MEPDEHLKIAELYLPHFNAEDPLAVETARLIVSANISFNPSPTDDEMCRYLEGIRSTWVHYVLTRPQDEIIAAASARHNLYRDGYPRQRETYVHNIAVQPAERGRRYGHLLMGHIAQQAIEHGDQEIELYPLSTSRRFFLSLGFKEVNNYMRAKPKVVLRKASK